MKKSWLVLFFTSVLGFAQNTNLNSLSTVNASRFPVFSSCENLENQELQNCFYTEVQDFVFQNFVVPEDLVRNNFKGNVKVLFEVNAEGVFKVIYVNAVD